MAATKTASKKVSLTRRRATIAARKAHERFKGRVGKKAPAWEKGGKQWARVLGHFGPSA